MQRHDSVAQSAQDDFAASSTHAESRRVAPCQVAPCRAEHTVLFFWQTAKPAMHVAAGARRSYTSVQFVEKSTVGIVIPSPGSSTFGKRVDVKAERATLRGKSGISTVA
jgi:hypothetical protein